MTKVVIITVELGSSSRGMVSSAKIQQRKGGLSSNISTMYMVFSGEIQVILAVSSWKIQKQINTTTT